MAVAASEPQNAGFHKVLGGGCMTGSNRETDVAWGVRERFPEDLS